MDVTPEHRHSLVVAMICCFKDSLVTGGVGSCWKGVGSCWKNVKKESTWGKDLLSRVDKTMSLLSSTKRQR